MIEYMMSKCASSIVFRLDNINSSYISWYSKGTLGLIFSHVCCILFQGLSLGKPLKNVYLHNLQESTITFVLAQRIIQFVFVFVFQDHCPQVELYDPASRKAHLIDNGILPDLFGESLYVLFSAPVGYCNALQAIAGQADGIVSVEALEREGRVYITITDNGPGISPELLSAIFTPFFSTKSGGSGIGLSISHRIMRLHGGDLTVDSLPGVRTEFRMTFQNMTFLIFSTIKLKGSDLTLLHILTTSRSV